MHKKTQYHKDIFKFKLIYEYKGTKITILIEMFIILDKLTLKYIKSC
jgi:hypothetical protein